jgi:hypothetical protein
MNCSEIKEWNEREVYNKTKCLKGNERKGMAVKVGEDFNINDLCNSFQTFLLALTIM